MLALTQDESFGSDATGFAGTFHPDARACGCLTASLGLTIRFDAASSSYTVSDGVNSERFVPGDIDSGQSSTALRVYRHTATNHEYTLSLTLPGTSGALTYQYVGAGFWQRVDFASDGSGAFRFDAFAYGVRTPDAAVPRTGNGNYAIDLVGALGFGVLESLVGSGSLQVDFATGQLVTSGTVRQVANDSGTVVTSSSFTGQAQLSGSANAFAGSFAFSGGDLAGALQGRFYGPAAEEVGAAFTASNADGRAASGVLIGRQSGSQLGNATLANLTASQVFGSETATIKANYTEATGAAAMLASTAQALVVSYNAAAGSYTVIAGPRSTLFTTGGTGGGADQLTLDALGAMRYVRAARWVTTTSTGGITSKTIDAFAFGLKTADSALPRTGSASYAVTLAGALVDASQPGPLALSGSGTLSANFATGAIATSGTATASFTDSANATTSTNGSFTGSATLASAANAFSGSLTVDVLGSYGGALTGHFYGPAAEEVGASAALRDAAGEGAAVTLVGASGSGASASSALRTAIAPEIVGTAGTGYSLAGLPGFGEASLLLTAADREAITSAAGFDVYRRTLAAGTVEARIYNAAAGPLALSYASFAELGVLAANAGTADPQRWYLPFGQRTTADQLPRTGTAGYAGLVFGSGSVAGTAYALGGTSSFTVDFARSNATGTLAITGSGAGGTRDFGSFGFQSAGLSSGGFTGALSANGGTGSLTGWFFGPQAQEIGAKFDAVRTLAGGGQAVLSGATLAKQNR
ncbi:hypothetical protein DD559_13535 [Sphingomonas pokkalii]|uniref:Transferrin-binding protein B C-lobe/N-lobe beta-barrel domain-containing protein n=1 Tax=Sphingomonas pokkalii TaxID=2175090 RepID=A0A2U0SFT5_9SPHN|nr:hypothetical protein DD559_13535 [Sphingomonas pokkalii]